MESVLYLAGMPQLQISLLVDKQTKFTVKNYCIVPSAVNDHSSFEKIQKDRRLLSLDHSYLNERVNETQTINTRTRRASPILSEICASY